VTAEPIAQPIPSVPARARASASAAAPALKDLVAHAIVQRRVISQPYAGLMHMLIFWGVTIQVLGTAVNLMQMRLFTPWVLDTFPRGPAYLGYELVMDLAGVAILLGVAMAAFRRIVLRPRTLPNTLGDFYPLVLLTLLPLAGFLAESMRLLAVAPPWARWSPAGNLVAHWLAAAGMTPAMAVRAHDPMVWLHAILGMTLLASIPFTKLRHVAMTPLFIAVRTRLRPGTLPLVEDFEQAESLGVGTVREFDSKSLMAFDACLQCGRCTAACPMYLAGMPYAPHALLRDLRSVMVDGLVHADSEVADAPLVGSALDQGSPWFCTTCGACVSQCPALIRPVDSFVDLRRYGVMTSGELPKTIADTLRNLERQGNPWGMPPEDRAQRARDLGLGVLGPGDETDVLFYMGCAAAYDERTAKSVRAFVRLMKEAGVQVAVLADETCCGEQARRLGHEWMFQEMAKQNLESLASVKYRQIVTQCPHCFNHAPRVCADGRAPGRDPLHRVPRVHPRPPAPAGRRRRR
jgi:heterodisulfide reductase subunit C/nitrate reductase gamma subunit